MPCDTTMSAEPIDRTFSDGADAAATQLRLACEDATVRRNHERLLAILGIQGWRQGEGRKTWAPRSMP